MFKLYKRKKTSDAWEQAKERVQQKRLVVNFSVPPAAGPWTKMARLKEVRRLWTSSISGVFRHDDGGRRSVMYYFYGVFYYVFRGFFRVEDSLVGFRMKKMLILFFLCSGCRL